MKTDKSISEKQNNKGTGTLLWSVIMSSPGPLVVGIGLLVGRSATQTADFVRRSAELLGIIMAYAVYRMTTGDTDINRKERLERIANLFVGAMMCLGGALMLILALLPGSEEKGSVIPGLVIALLGVTANTIFWIRYTKLNAAEPNAILRVQARLYRAKSLVDICVSIALLAVIIFPGSVFAYALDKIGSVIVALYLLWCGIRTVRERLAKPH